MTTDLPGLPAAAQREYDRIADVLGEARITRMDTMTIEALAVLMATWRAAVQAVEEQGAVVMSGGVAIKNPALDVQEQSLRQARAIMKEIGLTDHMRRRVSAWR